tara:strand:+ start:1224 stop:1460 length:237 start_codon:yes stop_codon:yes gene_type:complete
MATGKKHKFGSVKRGWTMREIARRIGEEFPLGCATIVEAQDYIIWYCKQTTQGKSLLDTVQTRYTGATMDRAMEYDDE